MNRQKKEFSNTDSSHTPHKRRTQKSERAVPKKTNNLQGNKKNTPKQQGERLNKFIANAGVCSRRKAEEFILNGSITINGKVVTELSTRVLPSDTVTLNGKKLSSEKKVYIIFNKPRGCISTKHDPEGRKTVYDYIQNACDESVEIVGRLDRNTSGIMLFTNDGELAERILHPRHNKMKIYNAELNKPLSLDDFSSISAGVELEDGFVEIDDLQFIDGKNRNQVGIQIHSGKNHVVKRIFAAFGYEVEKLDRVFFAGLTKKNLTRGSWRFLTRAEVKIIQQQAYE